MKKVAEYIVNSIKKIYGSLLLLILVLCLFAAESEYAYKQEFPYGNWLYACLGICFLLGLWGVVHTFSNRILNCKRLKVLMAILAGAFFLGLVFVTYHYWFKTGWDAAIVTWTAEAIATGQWTNLDHEYMSIYPNNVLLACMEALAIWIGGKVGIHYYFSIIIMQCFFFSLAGYLVFLTLEELCDAAVALYGWLIYLVFVGLSPWIVVPYSDGMGIFVPILIFYVYLIGDKKRWTKPFLVLLPILVYLGYKLKPQTAIIGIAIVVLAIIQFLFGEKEYKKIWIKRCMWCVYGLIIACCLDTLLINISHLQINPEKQIGGVSHYFMMGLNPETDGACLADDVYYSLSFESYDERVSANWELAKERLQNYSMGDLLQFWKRKLLMIFSDGTFSWWMEGEFFAEEQYTGNYHFRSILTNFYYPSGTHFNWFLNVMQTIWMGVLVFSAITSVHCKKKALNVAMLGIIGIFLFELLFEARARYLFTHAPIFIVLAVVGITQIRRVFLRRQESL